MLGSGGRGAASRDMWAGGGGRGRQGWEAFGVRAGSESLDTSRRSTDPLLCPGEEMGGEGGVTHATGPWPGIPRPGIAAAGGIPRRGTDTGGVSAPLELLADIV